ncbi:MAG: hypothetical protein PHG85_00740 [Candidatus Altiarchaeota archaeon]|nr:hypothetical protein [Candidatus Altiarchaeota archaeon]
MERNRKLLSAAILIIGLFLIAYWYQSHDAAAGISGALILAYISGLLALLIYILTLFYSWFLALPVISTIYAFLYPLLAPVLTPILAPFLLLLTQLTPFRWAANKVRKIKSIKVKRCQNCGKDMPAVGTYCPYCGRKAAKKKNAPHKKRSP